MTFLLCSLFVSVPLLVEVALRTQPGGLGARAPGLLLALTLAVALGGLSELAARPQRGRPWFATLLVALPLLVAHAPFEAALSRLLELSFPLNQLLFWSSAALAALAGAALCLWALRRATHLTPLLRATLSLVAAVALAFVYLHLSLPRLTRVVPYLAHGYLLLGLAALSTPLRRKALPPLALVLAAATIAVPARYTDLAAIFVWMAAAAAACAFHTWGLRLPPVHLRAWPALGLVVVAWLLSHLLVAQVPAAYTAARGGGALSGVVHSAHALTDFDGDGYGAAFAQRDCGPFDASVAPHRHEVLDNGIDDNCLAGDASSADAAWVRSAVSVNPPPPRHTGDVVLIFIDTLRFDTAHSEHMPTLARWAAEGVDFRRAYSTSSFTALVMMGVLSARHASSVRLRFHTRLSAEPVDNPGGLVPWLRKRGYATAIAGRLADTPLYYDSAYGAGFDHSEESTQEDDAAHVARLAERAWRALPDGRPRFLFVHHMQVHEVTGSLGRYQRNAAAVDESLAWLRARIGRDALWIVLSDHGEEFLEHGGNFHAATLYEEVVHVPLVWSGPGLDPLRVGAVSSLRSVMPTLMAALGAAPAPDAPGPYLCLSAGPCRDQPASLGLELGDRHLHGLVLGDRKIIHDVDRGHHEAYDLGRDPREQTPLRPIPPALLQSLQRWEEAAFGPRPDDFFWPYLEPAPYR